MEKINSLSSSEAIDVSEQRNHTGENPNNTNNVLILFFASLSQLNDDKNFQFVIVSLLYLCYFDNSKHNSRLRHLCQNEELMEVYKNDRLSTTETC